MIRNIDLSDVSDGKLYKANDMAKCDTLDCKGCSSCCRGMGDTILLDPYDAFTLTKHLKCSFSELLSGPVGLTVAEGIILPYLLMSPATNACSFLNESGRCQIHGFRPGFCRLFPLGRIYEDHKFSYFLQIKECPGIKTKCKIRKWIGVEPFGKYETFILDWHYYLKDLTDAITPDTDEDTLKALGMAILKRFYLHPYDAEGDFFEQFYAIFNKVKGNA